MRQNPARSVGPARVAARPLPGIQPIAMLAVGCGIEVAGLWLGSAAASAWIRLSNHLGAASPTDGGATVAALAQALALIAAAIGAGALPGGRRLAAGTPGLAGRDIPFLLAGIVFVALAACLSHAILAAMGRAVALPGSAAGLLVMILVLPTAHEAWLRGIVQPLVAERWGLPAAVIATATVAAIVTQGGPLAVALALAPQLLIGWVAATCRSVGAAAAMHVAYVMALAALSG